MHRGVPRQQLHIARPRIGHRLAVAHEIRIPGRNDRAARPDFSAALRCLSA